VLNFAASRKRIKSKVQAVAAADLQSSQIEDEVEIGWDSPKPLSGIMLSF
jgi:hypothetical protein